MKDSQMQSNSTESQHLQKKLHKCEEDRSDFEARLFQARRLLQAENRARKAAELDKDNLEKKIDEACDFMHSALDMSRDRGFLKRKKQKTSAKRHANDQNDINSSFSSEFSRSQTEGDFLGIRKSFKKYRSSTNTTRGEVKINHNIQIQPENKQSNHLLNDLDNGNSRDDLKFDGKTSDDPTKTVRIYPDYENIQMNVPCDRATPATIQSTPSKMSAVQEIIQKPSNVQLKILRDPKFEMSLQDRQHDFTSRTIFRLETCSNCLKKLRLSSSSLKCRSCSIYLHEDCRLQYTSTCVPKAAGTPNKKASKQCSLENYVLSTSPLLPPLVVYCINEVEVRGLSEEGIYRVSRSEKTVKELKKRILQGKSMPNLSVIDIHVICGCLKDFLRNLREPLIPTRLWQLFSNVTKETDVLMAKRAMFAAIEKLPQANRDTLAFLVMHLQRVASCKDIKMGTDNLAMVFGPTVLGYSSENPDQCAILTETVVQRDVMFHLLVIPTDYWMQFMNVDEAQDDSV